MRVRYNEQTITFRRTILEGMEVSTVEDLIDEIKRRLKNTIENISDKIITLRRGENEVLNSETPIAGLYNTEDQALHVVVGKHNIQLYLL
jgi:hypothetical protein